MTGTGACVFAASQYLAEPGDSRGEAVIVAGPGEIANDLIAADGTADQPALVGVRQLVTQLEEGELPGASRCGSFAVA